MRLQKNAKNVPAYLSFNLNISTSWKKIKDFSSTRTWPGTLDLSTAKLLLRLSPPQRGKLLAPECLVLLSCVQGSEHEPFCRSKWWEFDVEWRHWRRSASIKVEKEWERKERMGLNPPPPLQSFPLQQCLVIFIYWDDFARNPVAWLCSPNTHTHTHSLICCLVLSRLSSEKEGSQGQPKRPPQENTYT